MDLGQLLNRDLRSSDSRADFKEAGKGESSLYLGTFGRFCILPGDLCLRFKRLEYNNTLGTVVGCLCGCFLETK